MTTTRRLGHRPGVWGLLLGGLLTLGLACDSGEPGPDPPEPRSLNAALEGEDGVFEVADAVVTDEYLFVALAQRTSDRRPGRFTYEDVWMLTLDRRTGTWSAERISLSPEAERHPTLALTSDGTLHALWAETLLTSIGTFDRALWHAMRRPDGTWTPPKAAWQGPPEVGVTLSGADPATLVVDATGQLHAVFSADYDDGGLPGPQVNVITYRGGTWSAPTLPATRNDAQATGAALPGTGLVVAYADRGYGYETDGSHTEAVMAIRSGDGGQTWNEPVVVAALGEEPGASYDPHLERDESGTVHLTWRSRGACSDFPCEVWYAYSLDSGMSWESNLVHRAGYVQKPQLTSEWGEPVHLLFAESSYFGSEEGKLLQHLVQDGNVWETEPALTKGPITNGGVGAAVDAAGCLHLVWEEAEVDMGEVLSRELHYERLGPCAD